MAEKRGKRLGVVTTLSIVLVLMLWLGFAFVIAISLRNSSLQSMWTELKDGQGQIISSAVAALGLLTSAVLVPFVFKDRIRDLDSAVDEMKETMKGLEKDASQRLENLSKLLNDRMEEIEKRSSADVDRIGEVLEEIRSAVILSVSDGNIADPKHAKVFASHLYNDAVAALKRRVQEKPYLHKVTKEQIAGIRTMSPLYLDKLCGSEIISTAERAIVERVKEFAYKRRFGVSDVGGLNQVRSDFDRAFGENAAQHADAK